MGDFNVIKFEGKFLEKLLDTIHDFWRPWENRRLASAEADKVKMIGMAETEVEKDNLLTMTDASITQRELIHSYYKRIQERKIKEEFGEQQNIDAVVDGAILLEHNNDSVSDQKVDKDWIRKFFDKAKMVSDPEVQGMWSSILAGEIANPGSFSYRTLSILENMTKHEANAFIALCQFCYYGKILFYDTKYFNDNLNLSYNSVLLLQSIGLINYDFFLHLYYDLNKESRDAIIEFDNYAYVCRSQEPREISIGPIIALTQEGVQISSLIKKEMPKAYFDYVLQKIKSIYPMVEIYKAPVIQSSETYSEFDLGKIERI